MKKKDDEKKLPIPELANLSLPFRKETSYPASLEELLLILENMITELSSPIIRRNTIDLEPIEIFDFQEYLIKFEKVIEEYEIKLLEKIVIMKEIIFNNFVLNMSEFGYCTLFYSNAIFSYERKNSNFLCNIQKILTIIKIMNQITNDDEDKTRSYEA